MEPTLVSRRDPPPLPRGGESPSFSERPALTAGVIIGGHYVLERLLGSGGMGEVWAAEDARTELRVALKILLPHTARVSEIVARFEREALLLGRVQSDRAPHLLEYLVDDVYGPVLVTELVDGQTLADVIKVPLSVEQAVELGVDLADALTELHRASIVHRDLKPSNVILRRGPDGQTRAVIVDFGISRLVREASDERAVDVAEITTGDVVLGTVEYMAPEQILSCGEVAASADLYALGALLFRAITGGHVFGPVVDRLELVRKKLTAEAPPLPTGRQDPIARELARVIARALERNPSRRYQSAADLRADLGRVRELQSAAARRPATARPRRRVLAAITAVAFLAGIIVCSRFGHTQPTASSRAPRPIAAE